MRTDRIVFSLQIIWKSIIVTIYADTVGLRVVGTIVFSVSEILLILSKLVEFHQKSNSIKKSKDLLPQILDPIIVHVWSKFHVSNLIFEDYR